MIRSLAFGQYIHKDSVVHKLDPRIKLCYLLLTSILIFFITSPYKAALFSLFVASSAALAKIEFQIIIKNLRPFFFIFTFIMSMYAIFSPEQFALGLIAIWRFFVLVVLSLIFTFTTTISSITASIENLLRPLKIFGIHSRNAAVMTAVTLRFIPVMFLSLEKLREAMLARLANLRKTKNIRLMMLAMLEKMFKSAHNLSCAMQARLYNEDAESSKTFSLSKSDYISIFVILVVISIVYY